MVTAHPRSRGENYPPRGQSLRDCGSSPLTRGKLRVTDKEISSTRLIPAHAGKTRNSTRRFWTWAAHPRSRGENAAAWTDEVAATGSSPLTRGKPVELIGGGDERGLIPAHAGKTSVPSPRSPHPAAHPRSRGENSQNSSLFLPVHGSSPLTRGKRFRCADDRLDLGLIPAHAGKTSVKDHWPPPRRAHPRSRGENVRVRRSIRSTQGSSPLTRGKPTLTERTSK